MPRANQRPPVTMSGDLTARIMFAGRSSSLSAQIVSHVRDALFAKQIKPGDFLGTEKDLAAQFGTSRIVARDALRTLEALGIVEIRMGKGGGARIAHGNPRLFAEALAVQLDLTGVSVPEIMDAQRAIETLGAELAAENATPEDIARLRLLLKQAENAIGGLGVGDQLAQPCDVLVGRVLGRELGGEAFDRALRVHDLGGGDAGEVELHGERLGEQARIAVRDARAAALAHADLDDAERFERAQRVARDDAAAAELGGEVLLGAEEVAGLELLGE